MTYIAKIELIAASGNGRVQNARKVGDTHTIEAYNGLRLFKSWCRTTKTHRCHSQPSVEPTAGSMTRVQPSPNPRLTFPSFWLRIRSVIP
jgi:hypothetical protein